MKLSSFVVCFVLLFQFWVGAVWGSSCKPNILLIVSDDQGYNDLGVLGNGIITPNLDRLAKEGTRLTNFYVTWPACTPSRASLLTGRYPQRNGIYDMIRNEAPDYGHKYKPADYEATFERIGGMDLREIILPQVLKSAGYKSGIYGKWDLGSLKRFLPTSRGFDDFYGFVNTGIDYYTHERYGVPSMYRNLEPIHEDKGTYCTELFEREAMRFLKEYAGKSPFFLYVPFNAPHNSSALEPAIRSSIQAPEKFKNMYPEVKEEFKHVNYRYGGLSKVVTREARTRDFRASVTCMDKSIGKMLDYLEEKGELDNTIVIFFSDNGGGGGSDNSPLRGGKGQTFEGGIRVPCLVRWPVGNVKAGVVNDEFLSSMELFPSLAAATGSLLPEGLKLDGFDWWSVIRGDDKSQRKEMFWKRRNLIGVRVGKWKWVVMEGKGSGLFNLEKDPGEKKDVSEEFPEVMKLLKDRYANWLAEMEAAEPRGPFRDF
jgi:arylsulfatase A-like enzyme